MVKGWQVLSLFPHSGWETGEGATGTWDLAARQQGQRGLPRPRSQDGPQSPRLSASAQTTVSGGTARGGPQAVTSRK